VQLRKRGPLLPLATVAVTTLAALAMALASYLIILIATLADAKTAIRCGFSIFLLARASAAFNFFWCCLARYNY